MPAHLRDIRRSCDEPVCGAKATHELRNTFNAPMGDYCSRHAQRALTDQLERDANE